MKIKKIFKFFLSFILFTAFFTGCEKSSNINSNDTIYGSGKLITQTRSVPECSALKIINTGNVYLTQGDEQSVSILADDNIIDKVITTRDNGTLWVGLENGSYSNVTVKIYVSLKNVTGLFIEGAGNIQTENNISSENMICNVNGAGNITLTGSGNYMDCSIIGAGNISAKDFTVKQCKSLIQGTGSITLYASEKLDARVEGTGVIYYYGNPQDVNTFIEGLGQIIRK